MKRTEEFPFDTKISFLTIKDCSSEIYNHGKKRKYKCECVCGNIIYRTKSYLNLRSKTNQIMSCGCQHPSKINCGKKNKRWRGYGDISGYYFTETKLNAKERGLEFTITIEDMWNIYLKQDKKCALTKIPIFFKDSQRRATIEQTASIDRIDSDKGYTPDNIQVVHKDVNRMKNWYPQDRFIEICKLVAANN